MKSKGRPDTPASSDRAALGAEAVNDTSMSYMDAFKEQVHRIRDYGMYIAFLAIVIVFWILTDGSFVKPGNIVNLINATSFIAVLAIGMTLVIVIRHIDLSVGYLMGTLGAMAAVFMEFWSIPVGASIPLVLLLGTAAGLVTAFLVAHMKIPAFVATLAGWLLYRGTLQRATRSRGSIIITSDGYKELGQGFIPDFIPDFGFLNGWHKATMLLALVVVVGFIWSSCRKRRNAQSYGFKVIPLGMFIAKLVAISFVIGLITWRLTMPFNYGKVVRDGQGLSWAAVILAFVVLVFAYMTTRTTVGRHIFAVGGNPEAAQLNGISVKKITYLVFGSIGMLAGLAGILYSSWLGSATTTAGTGMELDVIAAAFVGGAAVSGGVGKVTSSIVGALVMASLINGMQLMAVDNSIQYMVRAGVLAAAVIFDVATRRARGTLVLPPWLENTLTRVKGLLPRRT